MRAGLRLSVITALAVAVMCVPRSGFAQAFTPPAQVGSVTAAWQWVDNTGHFLTDGTLLPIGDSVTTSALVEVDYGLTDRFAATAGMPYVFARYTGDLPPFSQLERDSCRCWHSSFQDVSVGARYRFGDEFWAVTPSVKYGIPTHNYPFEGEAVVGRHLRELQLGINTGFRLTSVLPKASVQAGYTYAVSEKPLAGVSNNRSNPYVDVGYTVTRSLFAHGGTSWLRTHGGLPFIELTTPDLYAQRDRILRSTYWHVTGGVSYSTTLADLFVGFEKYVSGHDTHNGIAYTVGATWYFDFSKTP